MKTLIIHEERKKEPYRKFPNFEILFILFQARNIVGWSDFSQEFLFYTRGKGKLPAK